MCTGILMKTTSGDILFGRTLEYSKKISYSKISNNRLIGIIGRSKLYGSKNRYINDGLLLDGINKYGLCVSIFNFPHMSSSGPMSGPVSESTSNSTSNSLKINNTDLSYHLLYNYKNVEEVKNALKDIDIINVKNINIHWSVVDNSGKFIIVEIIQNKLYIFDNKINVITNSPSFPEHLQNLEKYKSANPTKIKGSNTNGTSADILEGLYSSKSRFIRANYLLKYSEKIDFMSVFHILNNFDIPYGTVLDRDGLSERTVYTVVYDLTNFKVYFRNYDDLYIRKIF